MMMEFRDLVYSLFGRGFMAISREQLAAVLHRSRLSADVWKVEAREKSWAEEYEDAHQEAPYTADNGVSVIPVKGMVSHGASAFERLWFGMFETDRVAAWIQSAIKQDRARAIVLNVDSPGGYVVGTPELAEVVRKAAEQVPVIAYTSTLACSAAYWIASQAHYIYAAPSAIIGSIGVFTTHWDFSAYYKDIGISLDVFRSGANKAAGIGGTGLSKEQRKTIQEDVDAVAAEFKAAIHSRRPQAVEDVMDGRAISAKVAHTSGSGLVDHLATLDEAIHAAGMAADLTSK